MSLKKRLTALLVALALAFSLSVPAFAAVTPITDPGRWENFTFGSYKFNAEGFYFYNTQDAFQGVFGFNEAWDFLSPLAACWNDTLRCKFTYDGRDWLLQLWKGAYSNGLFTGGEIGLYNKRAGSAIEHYSAAAEQDWIAMGMAIYCDGSALFTRAPETLWWCTGFRYHSMSGMLNKPRANVVMAATLGFKTAGMAQAFASALAGKGFKLTKGALTANTPECYTLDGTTVKLVWQMVNEGIW